jgi:hypothetical protein
VLRFTWRMLEDHPEVFIARVQLAIRIDQVSRYSTAASNWAS